MPERLFQKVVIYPYVQFVPQNKLTGEDRKLQPVRFPWLNNGKLCIITVDEVITRERAPATKAGGHGYKYVCRVSWMLDGELHTQQSILWYDPRRLQWFVEVYTGRLPEDWEELYRQLGKMKRKRQPRKATVASYDGPTKRVPVLPLVRFVPADAETKLDYRIVPEEYDWHTPEGDFHVRVDSVSGMMRASELKDTKLGYRYSCYTSWEAGGEVFAQYNYLWFDAENLSWETDAPMEELVVDWVAENIV